MSRWRLAVLLLWLTGAVRAADNPALAALVKRADAIVAGVVQQVEPGPDGRRLRVAPLASGHLKGLALYHKWRVFVPTADDRPVSVGEACILCLQADRAHERYELLPYPLAKQAVSETAVDAVLSLADAALPLVVTLGTDKDSYVAGEPVTLIWRFRNTSDQPVSVCLSPVVCAFSNTSPQVVPPADGELRAADFKRLAPGETYDHKRVLNVSGLLRRPPGVGAGLAPDLPLRLPPGEHPFFMVYAATDDRLLDAAGQVQGRVEDLALVTAQRRLVIPVEGGPEAGRPLGRHLGELAPATREALVAKLASPVWTIQREAVLSLARDPLSLALPAVQAMAAHPWWRVRDTLAQGVALRAETVTPTLVAALYDRNRTVQLDALTSLSRQNPPAGLARPLYVMYVVLHELGEHGFLPYTPLPQRVAQALLATLTPEVGDLICRRVLAGQEDAVLLDRTLPADKRVLHSLFKPATPEETAQVVARWKAQAAAQAAGRAAVPPWPLAEFDAELARARASMLPDVPNDELSVQVALRLSVAGAQPLGMTATGRRALPRVPPGGFAGVPLLPPAEYGPAAVRALGPAAGQRVLTLQGQRTVTADSAALYNVLLTWQTPGLAEWLLARAYDGGFDAAGALARLDPARLEPHLEALLPLNPGAAVVLAKRGDKRALAPLVAALSLRTLNAENEVLAALTALTGEKRTAKEWVEWGAQPH